MGADLIHLEQVHLVGLIRSIELPHAIHLASQTMNGLVGSHVSYGAHLIDGYHSDKGEKHSRYFVELEGLVALGRHIQLARAIDQALLL